MSIILCEPQCLGFEHAAFNSALLATVHAAYPNDEILFFGDEAHLQEIENFSRVAGVSTAHVKWRPVKIIPPKLAGLRRLPVERALVRTVLHAAHSQPQKATRGVLFCSTTEITILALGLLLQSKHLRGFAASCPVRVVLHGILGTLLESRLRNPRRWGFSLHQAFRLTQPSPLEYIVLAKNIREHALRTELALRGRLHAIDMPHLWNENTPASEATEDRARNSGAPVNFGYFGRTVKGFPHFYAIANRVKANHPAARFTLIGFLNGYDLRRPYEENVVAGLSRVPLEQSQYSERAAQIDYAVWLADPAHYSLTASATFLDAFDYLKPLIYLANPYIDAYAQKLGDIGYRCTTLSEMEHVIEERVCSFPSKRYHKQQAALRAGRELFSPTTIAPVLKKIMENRVRP